MVLDRLYGLMIMMSMTGGRTTYKEWILVHLSRDVVSFIHLK